MMTRLLLPLFLLCSFAGRAQEATHFPGDSTVVLPVVRVTAEWLNDTDRYHYNQKKYYVTTVLPYVIAATRLFREIDGKISDPALSRRERKHYISTKEDEVRVDFEDKIKDLNVTQGELLVKLIARQTELNLYKMIREVKNPVAAIKWQAWARVHGFNLDRKYHPEEEKDLENIMEELGYPLPAAYRPGIAGKS